MPAADVAPVVHGRWVRDDDFFICAQCEAEMNKKNSLGVDNFKNYCPNCGAKMVEYSIKYFLIYYDKWSSFVMGEYETYCEALIAMMEARKWHEQHHGYNIVRFEIREIRED